MPIHLEFPDGANMAITEANIINYAGMYLIKRNGKHRPHQFVRPLQVGIDIRIKGSGGFVMKITPVKSI